MRFSKSSLRNDYLNEDDFIPRMPHEGFLRTPDKIYQHAQRLRTPDHKTRYDDHPFLSPKLLKALGFFTKKLNQSFDEENRIRILIPEQLGRDIVILSDNPITASGAAQRVKELLAAYSKNSLSGLHPGLLAEQQVETIQKDQRDKIARDLEIEASKTTCRIKFNFNVQARDFVGSGQMSFMKLKRFLQEKLDVTVVPSPHDTCVDLVGSSEHSYMAHIIGREAAPLIEQGDIIKESWLQMAYKKAARRVGIEKVERILRSGDKTTPCMAP